MQWVFGIAIGLLILDVLWIMIFCPDWNRYEERWRYDWAEQIHYNWLGPLTFFGIIAIIVALFISEFV